MKKSMIAVALLGAAGLLAACGGGGGEEPSGEESGSAVTAPIDNAKEVAETVGDNAAMADAVAAATHTLAFKVDGMS